MPNLDILTPEHVKSWFRPKLTVEHIAALISKNYTQAQCASLLKVSRQAVNQFIERHRDVLIPLIDATDMALSLRCKAKAIEILNSVDEVDVKKASLLQKATALGIFVDKYRLLSSQSTANVDLHLHAKLEEELKSLLSQP